MSLRRGWPKLVAAIALLTAAALAGYWYFEPATRPGWVAERMPTDPAATVTLYRWQDESGQWVMSSKPPPEGVEFEEVEYRHDTNVLPGLNSDDD